MGLPGPWRMLGGGVRPLMSLPGKKQLLAFPESETPLQEAPLQPTPGCESLGAPSRGMSLTFAKLNAITKSYVLSRP